MTNEAYARVKIDALLHAQGWNPQDTTAVRYEAVLPDGTQRLARPCLRIGHLIRINAGLTPPMATPPQTARRHPCWMPCAARSCRRASRCCARWTWCRCKPIGTLAGISSNSSRAAYGHLTHQDIGHMGMYVRLYDDLRRASLTTHRGHLAVWQHGPVGAALLGAERKAATVRQQMPLGLAQRRRASARAGARPPGSRGPSPGPGRPPDINPGVRPWALWLKTTPKLPPKCPRSCSTSNARQLALNLMNCGLCKPTTRPALRLTLTPSRQRTGG